MYKIAISAGHVDGAPGATYEGFSEYPETRLWAEAISSALSGKYKAVLIPPGSLTKKVERVNAAGCDLAMEVHFNAGGSATTKGCETLYFPKSEKGKRFAELCQKHLVPVLDTKDRGVKEGWYKMDRPDFEDYEGDKEGDEVVDYFLRKTNCPAVILEPEFVQQHESIIANRKRAAQAILSAVDEYFEPPAKAAPKKKKKAEETSLKELLEETKGDGEES